MGLQRSRDSAMEQFVFLCEKVSVAAAKRLISWVGGEVVGELLLLMALGSVEDVMGARPAVSSGWDAAGEGGGVGYASAEEEVDVDVRPLACRILIMFSRPLMLGMR